MATTKLTPIRALMNFNTFSDANLLMLATAVLKAMTGNANFPTPTLDLTVFATALSVYSAAIAAALDGGKNAKSARNKQRKIVVKYLRQLAVYAENNCNDDMSIFTSSGFTAKSKPSPAAPVAVPSFKSLDYGKVPGQLLVSIKASAGARSYILRFAPLTGTTPGPWTTLNIANIKKAISITNLTSGTTYAFQVQALGMLGLSAWSDSSTIMCT
jgi:hypothetical protein